MKPNRLGLLNLPHAKNSLYYFYRIAYAHIICKFMYAVQKKRTYLKQKQKFMLIFQWHSEFFSAFIFGQFSLLDYWLIDFETILRTAVNRTSTILQLLFMLLILYSFSLSFNVCRVVFVCFSTTDHYDWNDWTAATHIFLCAILIGKPFSFGVECVKRNRQKR